MGQLACFIEFLGLISLWSRWQDTCPLIYASPNAPPSLTGYEYAVLVSSD